MSMIDDAADQNKDDIKEAQRRKQAAKENGEENDDGVTKPTRPSDVAGEIQDTLTGESADKG